MYPQGFYSLDHQQGNLSLSFLSSLGFVMSIIYVGLGIYFLVAENLFRFSNMQRIGFGLILISYGSFRFYVALKKKKESELEDGNED
jgi:hypothetical protein